jgi:hypothetical protein
MAIALQLSSRQFVQHHTFPLITFDKLACNHATTSIYVHCKVCPIDAPQVAIVSKKNLILHV